MPVTFHMQIEDIFFFRDGRTVFAGPIDEGGKAILDPGPATILVDDQELATIHLEGEVIPSRSIVQQPPEVRAVSTRDATGLTKEAVATKKCRLEGTMRYSGHRDLLGIDSPPSDYVPDDMTLGPFLPAGWDGDAWMKLDGRGYFLRAWNKKGARFAIAQGSKYEETRARLLEEIAGGGKTVEIRAKATTS